MDAAPLDLDPDLVLGIDPGTIVVGYGAVRRSAARGGRLRSLRAELVETGVLRASRGRPLPERLGLLLGLVDELVLELRPGTVVVERAFTDKNPLTALRLGEGRGLAIAVAARRGCRVVERTPAEAKRLVAGSGSASKSLVSSAVGSLLGRSLAGSPLDATDALALALSELSRAHDPDTRPDSARGRLAVARPRSARGAR